MTGFSDRPARPELDSSAKASREEDRDQLASGEQEATLRLSLERLRDAALQLVIAQEADRLRMAHALHDDIGQQLAGLSIGLSEIRRLVARHDQAALEALLALQQETMNLAHSVQSLSHDLHPGMLQQVGLAAELESHCAEFRRQHGLEVTFDAPNDLTTIAPDVALCLFRAAQEALCNVAKHAAARHARVVLSHENGQRILTITDDGKGFDPALERRSGGGLGLLTLEKRAVLLHGTVHVESGAGRGTTVRIAIPVETR